MLPQCYWQLYNEDSEIADLYPKEFAIDLNGRTLPWEGINLIPFIDQHRILEAVGKIDESGFSERERERNTIVDAKLYIHVSHSQMGNVKSPLKAMDDIPNSQSLKELFKPYVPPEGKSIYFSSIIPNSKYPIFKQRCET